ncbi:hypothetical protein EA58_13140 [Photobacterium galatheae]|uniref:DUF7738 domain-containing protein n=2 Tax=Photobacterium galatheae TaxID=1654360 RepID=A0A066RUN7_9GAMM|nr:hypothetical protein EA58_13140 [Photobacterium galatheae]
MTLYYFIFHMVFIKVFILLLTFVSEIPYFQPEITNTSEKPVRLVITPEEITFDGQRLSFEKPLKDWVDVFGEYYIQGHLGSVVGLGSELFIFPELGIELEVRQNYQSPQSDWVKGEEGTISEPMKRLIANVKVYLAPNTQTKMLNIEKKYQNHPYSTMSAKYAINFYGAIVDSDVPTEKVIHFADGVTMDQYYRLVAPGVSSVHDASLLLFHFWGEKPQAPVMLEIHRALKKAE